MPKTAARITFRSLVYLENVLLPLTLRRFDPEGRGYVAVCDFLEKLGFHHDKDRKPGSTGSDSMERVQ